MPFILNAVFGLVGLLFPLFVNADSNPILPDSGLKPSQLKALSLQPAWLKLLHYRNNSLIEDFDSYVDDASFFYAPNGRHDPEAELIATLQAFFDSKTPDNSHAQCRFPARLRWLSENLGLDTRQLPAVNCKNYQQWRQEMNAGGVSLIFASAYLNSPSSMFGHTLLRLDPKPGAEHSDWLSYALNFGAIIDPDDNSLFYAFKGIAGGYPGRFQLMPFFKKIQEYSFMENRDLWEYQLNLSAIEIERLMAHLWELQNIDFAYFYVSENCSFRLLELLDIARPGSHLTEGFTLTVIPSDIIQAVNEHDFIASVHYRPAQAVELQHQLKAIPQNYRPLIESLSENPEATAEVRFKQAPLTLQKQLLAAAYQLLRYQAAGAKRDATAAKKRFKLLKLLSNYPPDSVPVDYPVPTDPKSGHRSHLASVAAGYGDGTAFTELGYRQNYHDLLDNPVGYFKGAAIDFMNLNVRFYEDNRYRLQKLELLNITSLSPRDRFFKPISWRLSTGAAYQDYGDDRLSVFVNGGAGVTYSWFDRQLGYALVNAHIEHNDNFDYALEPGLGLTVGQLYYFSSGTSQLLFDGKIFIDGSYLYQAGLKHNFVLARNHALRFSVKQLWNNHENFNQAQLSYRFYF
ncbi:MAG: hypothetical protein CVV13_09475 [Gammaproteobacteria bacterium HGW-Gammaproteobacteria-3]|nr:MAG: hypothetical protein CVV13_09475 [Gammaproteobacteria bacterium HGW-Gammaproteobacteria-3]